MPPIEHQDPQDTRIYLVIEKLNEVIDVLNKLTEPPEDAETSAP
jgi:hypothetical protein